MRMIRIFLSSPGDCQGERAAAHAISARFNADPLVASFAKLVVVAWDWADGVPLDALASPQVSVNRRLTTPEECDIFVGIFRRRFGTPMPTTEFRREDGSDFKSGSEYEFDRAWRARRGGAAAPEILMYRLAAQDTQSCNVDAQLDLLNAFFDRAPFKVGDQWTGSINQFNDTAGFERQLEGHLRVLLTTWHPGARLPLRAWLEVHARRVEHDAGPRYTRDTHVDSDLGQVFDWLLARPGAVHAFDDLLSHLWKKLDDSRLAEFKEALQRIAVALREDPRWRSPPDFNATCRVLERLAAKAWELAEATEREEPAGSTFERQHIGLQKLAGQAQEALRQVRKYAEFAQRRILLLTGPAGQGKTHTLVHELKRTVDEGSVAVGALGQKLSAWVDLRSALLQAWEFTGSFGEFLDTLENAAAQKDERALLIVDALNETPNRERWKNELNGILQEVLQRPHLAVAFSVRSDYRLHVLPEEAPGKILPWAEHEHTGFAGIEPDALLGYCAHYGVIAPVAPPIGELGNPLYVQLLVRSLQNRSNPTHWLPSWLEVWESWIARLEGDARARLPMDASRSQPVRRCLNKLATTMIASGKFQLHREEADQIALTTAGVEGLVGLLCSAGALIDRIENDDDIVEFGFERLCDTFLADRLLAGLFEGKAGPNERRHALEVALGAGGELAALAVPGHFDAPLSSRRAGLLEALCLAVPPLIGAELPDLIPVEAPDSRGWVMRDFELREAFTDSVRWRCRPAEFAADRRSLWRMYRRRGSHHGNPANLNELLRLALIPGHPFAMEHLLHPRLSRQSTVGTRDAAWSIELVPLWLDEGSNLSLLVRWATESSLSGLHIDMATPAARLLAWLCATSQQGLREQATRGLTRILAESPAALPQILRDFLPVNDDYVLESVLTASLGVMIDGREPPVCETAARLVFAAIFEGGKPRCHLTIRHYARRIVELAAERGWLAGVDLACVRPPYTSVLPLADVPSKQELVALDRSGGFGGIVGSALGRDFYWYVMGATSGGKPFSSEPLPGSSEPVRAYGDGVEVEECGRKTRSEIFDIPLAARFVVWNCRRLGWTSERFNEFDTGYEVHGQGRISRQGRTERIGKKYQWISWQTMLAFLADNYRMTPEYLTGNREYDTPHQIGYVEVFDPSRWLYASARLRTFEGDFWRVPSLPRWPTFDDADIRRWGASPSFDLPPLDVLNHVPKLPQNWGEGPWLRVMAEHAWRGPQAPGVWGLDQELDADIWWQLIPALIQSTSLPKLMSDLDRPEVRAKLKQLGRIDLEHDRDAQLADWPGLRERFDRAIESGDHHHDAWLPVPWMYLAGECGASDRSEGVGSVVLPWPRLFRTWNLTLDLHHGVVRRGNEVLFGLAGWVMHEDALFARRDLLMAILAEHGLSLIWWVRGERRAFVRDIRTTNARAQAWIDTHGVAYLASDGRVQVAWLGREVRDDGSTN